MMKSYPQLTLDYILYEMSCINIVMYSSVIPSYNPEDDKQISKIKGLTNSEFFTTMKDYGKTQEGSSNK